FLERDTYLLKTSFVFDVSVTELFGWFYGGRLAVLPPGGEKDPRLIWQAIENYGVTHLNFVPSMFNVFLGAHGGEREIYSFKALRYIFLAGEELVPDLVRKFHSLDSGVRLENIYGPTEATIYATNYGLSGAVPPDRIPIGKPMANLSVYILGKYDHLQPLGVPGELCISGTGLAMGYLNNPELTSDKFISVFPGETEPTARRAAEGTRLYRTGDLARRLPDGNVQYLGRIDQQVKIRGFRIEPGEIENRLLQHPAVTDAVVCAIENTTSDTFLCAFIATMEGGEPLERTEALLKEWIMETMPDYMVPAYFQTVAEIPLTTTGKKDRKKLTSSFTLSGREVGGTYKAPETSLQSKLADLWADVLGMDAAQIGIDTDFFGIGGHSLKATILVSKIHKYLDIRLPISQLFDTPTIRRLAAVIKETDEQGFKGINPVEKKEYYTLSSAQKRMYVLQHMEPGSILYNISGYKELKEPVDTAHLQAVFKQLINRHESLRTSFMMHERGPVQRVREHVDFRVMPPAAPPRGVEKDQGGAPLGTPMRPAGGEWGTAFCDGGDVGVDFIRPFDLNHAPLMRVALAKRDEETSLLLVDMHHIISDGVSVEVLLKEFEFLFNRKETLPLLEIQYKEYARWQASAMEQGDSAVHESYWLELFAGNVPVLELPYDFPRPTGTATDVTGNIEGVLLGEKESAALRELAGSRGVTLYMVIIAVFNLLLSRLGGGEDIVVGTPTAGRMHEQLHGIIGMFVNTLPLRFFPGGDKTFISFLDEVKEGTLAAFEHQEYQFEDLVERVVSSRAVGRHPIFDVFLVYRDASVLEEGTGILVPGRRVSKFDITLTCRETASGLDISMEYAERLFKKETIGRFLNYFQRLASAVGCDPGRRLGDYEMLPAEERQLLVEEMNRTEVDFPHTTTIHRLFEEQAIKTPGNTALIGYTQSSEHDEAGTSLSSRPDALQTNAFGSAVPASRGGVCPPEAMTYADLNRCCDLLAAVLRERGVLPGDVVGIMVERSFEMVIGVLGVLKAGAAYMPVSPQFPARRVRYMLEDSCAALLLTTGSLAEAIGFERFLRLDGIDWNEGGNVAASHYSPMEPAYIIYTSGSTGKPKGVVIRHESAVNVLSALQREYPFLETDTYLLKTSFVFDVSVTELFGWFYGGRLAVLEAGGEKDPLMILEAIENYGVTHINFVPSMFSVFLGALGLEGNGKSKDGGEQGAYSFKALRYLLLAGEELLPDLVRKFRDLGTGVRLENIYGPTEAAVYATNYSLSGAVPADRIPIGKPMANLSVYVLGINDQLQPMGVPGELCIAGTGLAMGYLNNPELTAQKFVLLPFTHFSALLNDVSKANLMTRLLYRTGDLARRLSDGNVEYLGRIDQQVKIRGFRIEPGEIENRILEHTAINDVVVCPIDTGKGDIFLCAFITAAEDGETLFPILREWIMETMPEYMVPAQFQVVREIPLTATGKKDRKQLVSAFTPAHTTSQDRYVAPETPLQVKLAELWADVLNLEANAISSDADFFHLGGHSLKATILVSKIHKQLEVRVPLSQIFDTSTIRGLATVLENSGTARLAEIEAVEEKEYYPLSSAQKRMYILQQMEPGSIAYNISGYKVMEAPVDMEHLRHVFEQLMNRHESLRTSFVMHDDRPVQRVHAMPPAAGGVAPGPHQGAPPLGTPMSPTGSGLGTAYCDGSDAGSDFIRPFDLSYAPLMRVAVVKREKNTLLMMVDMHHIISDGISIELLLRDFALLYDKKETLPALDIQYKDYAQWQLDAIRQGELAEGEAYWLEVFSGELPVLELPYDFARPVQTDFEGEVESKKLTEEESRSIKELANARGVTLFMLLLSVFNLLLSRLSGDEDIVVGTPAAGRLHAQLHGIIGMFVNTLPLRISSIDGKNFVSFLSEVKQTTLAAFENQEYQFEDLVERVAAGTGKGRHPLFDVFFVFQSPSVLEEGTGTLVPGKRVSKFDLTLTCREMADGVVCSIEYAKTLFKKDTIRRFLDYFSILTSAVVAEPEGRLGDYDMLPAKERRLLLEEMNRTETAFPDTATIHQLLEEQVMRTPGNTALVGTAGSMTYREFNRRCDSLAAVLRERGVLPGDVVGILAGRSFEMVIGVFAVLKAGAAYMPVSPRFPARRVRYMLEDSCAALLLTTGTLAEEIGFERILPLDGVNDSDGSYEVASSFHNTPAYIIYTAGSTGHPKGVVIRHQSAVNILAALQREYRFLETDTYLLKTSFVFDVSVTELFGWFYGGRLAVLEAGGEKDPRKILGAVENYGVTHLNFVPSMFSVLVEQLGAVSKGETFSFKALRYIFIAGEELLPDLVRKFESLRTGVRLENIYGPTEATIYATNYSLRGAHREDRIPIGRPMANLSLYILGKNDQLQPLGVPGELCISGTGLAMGYLNNPELTAQKFIPKVSELTARRAIGVPRGPATRGGNVAPLWSGGGSLYRTGDLARRLPDGNVEYLGRLDQQVKIRGFRIEPGEIENRLLEHPAINDVVVCPMDSGESDTFLCAFITAAEDGETLHLLLREWIMETLPEYMVPAHFQIVREIPLTATGKKDRKQLVSGFNLAGTIIQDVYIAPETPLQEKLAALWADVLGMEAEHISIDADFFRLGGHSLKATILVSKIHRHLEVDIPLSQMFDTSTIRGLATVVEQGHGERFSDIAPVEAKEYYPLSSAQKRMYILQQMEPGSIAYNISGYKAMKTPVDMEHLQHVFRQLIRRHESFRTSFIMHESGPVQRIHPRHAGFHVEKEKVHPETSIRTSGDEFVQTFCDGGDYGADFIMPFDLSCAPLLRVALVEQDDQSSLLLLDMHHIISDGMSIELLLKEFALLYEKKKILPPLDIQYKDFSHWQAEKMGQGKLANQETYWLETFSDDFPVLELPYDLPRPTDMNHAGEIETIDLGEAESKALRELADSRGMTPFMLLLAMFNLLLSRLSGAEDIIVGTPAAGRVHARLHGIIGMFVNTLPIRLAVLKDKGFIDFLEEVKQTTLAAFDNQEYQFEDLVERVSGSRAAGRHPIFDVFFIYIGMEKELGTGILHPNERVSKFDVSLHCIDAPGGITFFMEYSKKLFKAESIRRFLRYLYCLATAIINEPEGRLSDYDMLPAVERRLLLDQLNRTEAAFPDTQTIHGLFEDQVIRTPANTALMATTDTMTYAELNRRCDVLAMELKERGVLAGDVVGIMVKRSMEMVIGILGILKVGASYMPVSPRFPERRVRYMLEDSCSTLLLTNGPLAEEIGFDGILRLDEYDWSCVKEVAPSLCSAVEPAYIIYTSGSTGKPKGVVIRHESAVNILSALQREYPFLETDTFLLKTSFVFDVSVTELFGWFYGGRLAVLEAGGEKDPRIILEAIDNYGVTHLNFVPSMFSVFLEHLVTVLKGDAFSFKALRYIFLAGEELLPDLVRKFYAMCDDVRLENIYGPTEATIYATNYSLSSAAREDRIPIGKPMANVSVFILGKNDQLQPFGVPGELCISGTCLAMGYLNNPELTSDKFIPIVPEPTARRAIGVPRGASPWWGPGATAPAAGGTCLYRTGDLARRLPDGNVEYLGRIDQQVKIRGFRIEPGEIENRLLEFTAINDAVVCPIDTTINDTSLCAFITVTGTETTPDSGALFSLLREWIMETMPEYMVPSHFHIVREIPLTTTGKKDRKQLVAGFDLADTTTLDSYVAPQTPIQSKLAGLWADVLGMEPGQISIDADFFKIGGHSLTATILIARIQKELGTGITLAEVFGNSTVRLMAKTLDSNGSESFSAVEAVEKKDYYGLSSAQERLFFLWRTAMDNTLYNMSSAFKLEGDVERIEEACRRVIARHESLRTSFHILNDTVIQRVHEEVDFQVQLPERGYESFIRPFDLSRAPLLRVGICEHANGKRLLLVDMHHIVSDGLSLEILARDFMAFYGGGDPGELTIHYKDYCQWLNRYVDESAAGWKSMEAYWLEQMEGELPVVELPYDFPRPMRRDFSGGSISFALDTSLTGQINSLAAGEGVTPYMVLLGIFYIVIANLSGMEDVIIGTPTAGRRHADVMDIIGMFVNTLALRNYPADKKVVREFIREVGERTTAAFDNQEYPFERLVDQVLESRDPARNPLFDVMFSMENMAGPRAATAGVRLEPYQLENTLSRFDLMLVCREEEGRLFFVFEYAKALFTGETVRGFAGYFETAAASVVDDADVKVCEVQVLPEKEKLRILEAFNGTGTEFPVRKTLHELFSHQALQSPYGTALTVPGDGNVSYGELETRSNRMARCLVSRGVGIGDIVGLLAQPSFEQIECILGILKAGAAYLPLDPVLPSGRARFMLLDCSVRLVVRVSGAEVEGFALEKMTEVMDITRGTHGDAWSNDHFPFSGGPKGANGAVENAMAGPGGEDFSESTFPRRMDASGGAYVIYTSGTTGTPKGVLTNHYNVTRVVKNTNYIEFTPNDRVLQLSNYAFDGSVFGIYGALLNGSSLVLPQASEIIEVERLGRMIRKEAVTVFFITSALFNMLVDSDLESLRDVRKVLPGGDRVSPDHARRVLEFLGKGRLINGYGPTETTVFATYYFIDQVNESGGSIPIGKPLANTEVYILNRCLSPVPIGVTGELYIGGFGNASGYVNRPELTAEKFIPSPFTGRLDNVSAPAQTTGLPEPYNDKSAMNQITGLSRSPNDVSAGNPITWERNSLYKTGDLVRRLPDGNIEFLGRIDHQVKLRGFRVELGEIESVLEEHSSVKDAVVLDYGKGAGRFLYAFLTMHVTPSLGGLPGSRELREFLLQRLPDYMVPSFFKTLEKFPLTANGKVDRKALPSQLEMGIDTGERETPPETVVQKKLAGIWTDILGLSQEESPRESAKQNMGFGIDTDFFSLGGHSLSAAALITRIHERFNVKITLADIFENPNIRGLEKVLEMAVESKYREIEVVEKKEYYPLSAAQNRLYVLQQLEPTGTAYNMPFAVILEDEVDAVKLEYVFRQLLHRHESLRTSFHMINGDPVQVIHKEVAFKINNQTSTIKNARESDTGIPAQTAVNTKAFGSADPVTRGGSPFSRKGYCPPEAKPFDLSKAPLLRVDLVPWENGRSIMLADMHHIISDGVSTRVFLGELSALYRGEDLEPLAVQYKDFAFWREGIFGGSTAAKQEEYWVGEFSGELPKLDLPIDFPRPAVQSFEGARLDFRFSPEETEALKCFVARREVTLFMVLAALYSLLLSKLGNTEDVVFGIPTAGRSHRQLEPLIGLFVNTLALRFRPEGKKEFELYLEEVKNRTLRAFENQEYPLERLIDRLGSSLERDAGRSALFDTMMALQDIGLPGATQAASSYEKDWPQKAALDSKVVPEGFTETASKDRSGEFSISPLAFDTGVTKFDFTWGAAQTDGQLVFTIEYCTKLFKEESIRTFFTYFKNLTQSVLEDSQQPLSDLELLGSEERTRLLSQLNDTGAGYTANKRLHQLFREQAVRTPDAL
ncbi:MAG: amino acid adenylation domain-containing protein, partial [bacterium]|nr:amino acid adenylation domain-containing protein [bacterium]